jgi:hypothetical protein
MSYAFMLWAGLLHWRGSLKMGIREVDRVKIMIITYA